MAPWPGFGPGIFRVTAEHTRPDYTTRAHAKQMKGVSILNFTGFTYTPSR
jgi:hypothetical protein